MGQALLWRHWLASGVASVRIRDVADRHAPQNTWPHIVEYNVLPADNRIGIKVRFYSALLL